MIHCDAAVLLLLQRRAMLGLPEGDTDPFLDTLGDEQSTFDRSGSGLDSDDQEEDLECLNEPPELQAARAALAAYSARSGEQEPTGEPQSLGSLNHAPEGMTCISALISNIAACALVSTFKACCKGNHYAACGVYIYSASQTVIIRG